MALLYELLMQVARQECDPANNIAQHIGLFRVFVHAVHALWKYSEVDLGAVSLLYALDSASFFAQTVV